MRMSSTEIEMAIATANELTRRLTEATIFKSSDIGDQFLDRADVNFDTLASLMKRVVGPSIADQRVSERQALDAEDAANDPTEIAYARADRKREEIRNV